MEQVKVYYDRAGNTLTVWFGDTQKEYVCEKTADEVILMKDKAGRVIGLEKLNFAAPAPDWLRFSFEAVNAWRAVWSEAREATPRYRGASSALFPPFDVADSTARRRAHRDRG